MPLNFTALVFDAQNKELIEINEKDKTAKCPYCITACAASLNSEDEQRMKTDAAIDKNAIFLKNVYNKDEDTKNIKIDFCDEQLTPSIVWDSDSSIFLIGYEVKKFIIKFSLYLLNTTRRNFILFKRSSLS